MSRPKFNKRDFPVDQYDCDGKLVSQFNSALLAIEALGVNPNSFMGALNPNQAFIYKGFIYKYRGYEHLYPKLTLKKNVASKPIYIYNTDGKLVAEYFQTKDCIEERGLSVTQMNIKLGSKTFDNEGLFYTRRKKFNPIIIEKEYTNDDVKKAIEFEPYVVKCLYTYGNTCLSDTLVETYDHELIFSEIKKQYSLDVRFKEPIYSQQWILELLPTKNNQEMIKKRAKAMKGRVLRYEPKL